VADAEPAAAPGVQVVTAPEAQPDAPVEAAPAASADAQETEATV